MSKLKVLELFGGIGACTKAMKNIGIDYDVVDYVEVDKYACKSYNSMNNSDFEPQDIREYHKTLDTDFIMHGSPCQDFSLAGLQKSGDIGSGTRSSLMWETVRIVSELKPKYVIWENVKNVLSKSHRHNFDSYLAKMEELGYTNQWKVLNAKNFGIPQNRERVFVVSVLDGEFRFPDPMELELRLVDMLDDEVDKKYYLSPQHPYQDANEFGIRNIHLNRGYSVEVREEKENADGIDVIGNYSKSNYCATFIVGKNGISPTVRENHGQTTGVFVIGGIGDKKSNNGKQWYQQNRIYDNGIGLSISTVAHPYYIDKTMAIRKLTPLECWRLMGFDDDDFYKASSCNSDRQLLKQAGNSIVVNVLEEILKCLIPKQYYKEK